MIQTPVEEYVPAEICAESELLKGNVFCPVRWRISDLLNSIYATGQTTRDRFLEFIPLSGKNESELREREHKEYLRKAAIDLLALSDSDSRRGAGAKSQKIYPFTVKQKRPVRLKIDIDSNCYILTGDLHCKQEQKTKDVLDDEKPFLPLTDVIMPTDFKISGHKSFVAVNKDNIVSCYDEI